MSGEDALQALAIFDRDEEVLVFQHECFQANAMPVFRAGGLRERIAALMPIAWFPGHMASARKKAAEKKAAGTK